MLQKGHIISTNDFIKDIFASYISSKKVQLVSHDENVYKKSIEQLVTHIINDLEPFKALEYPTKGLLAAKIL